MTMNSKKGGREGKIDSTPVTLITCETHNCNNRTCRGNYTKGTTGRGQARLTRVPWPSLAHQTPRQTTPSSVVPAGVLAAQLNMGEARSGASPSHKTPRQSRSQNPAKSPENSPKQLREWQRMAAEATRTSTHTQSQTSLVAGWEAACTATHTRIQTVTQQSRKTSMAPATRKNVRPHISHVSQVAHSQVETLPHTKQSRSLKNRSHHPIHFSLVPEASFLHDSGIPSAHASNTSIQAISGAEAAGNKDSSSSTYIERKWELCSSTWPKRTKPAATRDHQ